MNDEPLISIITPTYNHENYIGQCINSVLSQTYKNWEMIIIDDGSKDNTLKVISTYNDNRIKYFTQENLGPYKLGETYNKALSLSKGELIAILEGDDFWPKEKLKRQIKAFDDPNIILSHGNSIFVYNDNNCKVGYIRQEKNILNNDPIGASLYGFAYGFTPISVTMMIRRTSLLKIGGFVSVNNLPYIDLPTELKLSLIGRFKYIPDIMGCFRRHKQSITHNLRKENNDINYRQLYFKKFIDFNRSTIKDLGISEDLINKNFYYYKYLTDSGSNYIVDGKELFELGDMTNARKAYKKIFELNAPTTFKLLAYSGIASTYCGINLSEILTRIYWRLKSLSGHHHQAGISREHRAASHGEPLA